MADILDIPFKATDGKIPASVWRRLVEAVTRLDGKTLIVSLKEQKRNRSLNQNAFYWGVVIPAVTQMFRDAGNYLDPEETHEFLKHQVGKLSRVVVTPDGEVIKTVGSTSKLSKMEFEVYQEQIRAWAAQWGCVIPFPHEESK